MKNYLFCFLLFFSLNIFAQDTLKQHGRHNRPAPVLSFGITDNKFQSINTILKEQNFNGEFEINAFNYGFGFSKTYKHFLAEWLFDVSGNHFSNNAKQFRVNNKGFMFIYQYRILNKGWLQPSLFWGIHMMTTRLNIDSINDAPSLNSFGSIVAQKNCLDIPLGLQLTHFIRTGKGDKKKESNMRIGYRVAYHVTFYQGNWNVGFKTNNNLKYELNFPHYLEASALFGF